MIGTEYGQSSADWLRPREDWERRAPYALFEGSEIASMPEDAARADERYCRRFIQKYMPRWQERNSFSTYLLVVLIGIVVAVAIAFLYMAIYGASKNSLMVLIIGAILCVAIAIGASKLYFRKLEYNLERIRFRLDKHRSMRRNECGETETDLDIDELLEEIIVREPEKPENAEKLGESEDEPAEDDLVEDEAVGDEPEWETPHSLKEAILMLDRLSSIYENEESD